jgi:hypothetical protein
MLGETDLTDIHITFHPTARGYVFFSSGKEEVKLSLTT